MMISEKSKWCFQSIFLFLPFVVEMFAYPLFGKIQPQWLSAALFFICYTYVFYGLAVIIHSKWRKKVGEPIIWGISGLKWNYAVIALLAGIAFRRLEYLVLAHPQTPMLIWESVGYINSVSPLWMGIAGYALQFMYYLFEFTLVACIADCAQKACEKLGWSKRIPWGGLFLGITWGLIHIVSQDLSTGLLCFVLSVLIGGVYVCSPRKPVYAWICVFAAYLL